jgi:hypothetical protein
MNPDLRCQCGDADCADTFGQATRGQDRTACCQYCGWFDCDVCGWAATASILTPAATGPDVSGWQPGDPAPF